MELNDLAKDPITQFQHWLREAEVASGAEFPNSMSLATCTPDGHPSVRVVLLKGVNKNGFVFFTNYESRKGAELAANPRAALCFYWEKLGRQVRVDGTVERLPPEESTEYYHSRPRGSQIGAWASPQSQEVASRAQLDDKVAELEQKWRDLEQIPRPEFWGGYRVVPSRIEFWINGLNRLHDRFVFTRAGAGWKSCRLAP